MPQVKLELDKAEDNLKQLHGIQDWIKANHFSFIKKYLLIQLYNDAYDYLILHPEKATARDYQCFNKLINSDKEKLEYCHLVINLISSVPHFQKIVATAQAYFSVFSSPMQINLSPAGKDENQQYRNLKTLEFLKIYLSTGGSIIAGRKQILLSILHDYSHQRLMHDKDSKQGRLNANHFEIVNEAFNYSVLPNILFCRLLVKNIDRRAHKANVLKQEQVFRDHVHHFYLQLTAPIINERRKMAWILLLLSFTASFYDSKFSAATYLIMIGALVALVCNQNWVDRQVDAELVKRINLRLDGNTYGGMSNEFEPKISALAIEVSHSALGALSFFASGLRVVNPNIQHHEAKIIAKKTNEVTEIKEIKSGGRRMIAQYGERSDSEAENQSDWSGSESDNEQELTSLKITSR